MNALNLKVNLEQIVKQFNICLVKNILFKEIQKFNSFIKNELLINETGKICLKVIKMHVLIYIK